MLGDATFHRERLARLVVDARAKTAPWRVSTQV